MSLNSSPNLLSKGPVSPVTPRNEKTSPETPLTILEVPRLPVPGERNATYKSACLLAHQIEYNLDSERHHYRNRAGHLLTTLDEVVSAILNDDLAIS